MQASGKTKRLADCIACGVCGHAVSGHAAIAALQSQLNGLHGTGVFNGFQTEAVGHHLHHLGLHMHPGETTGTQPGLQFLGCGVGGELNRKGEHPARVVLAQSHELLKDGLAVVVRHRLGGVLVKQMGGTGEQQLEVVVQLGHGAHCRARAAHRVGLVDGNGGGHAFHLVHRRAVHAVQELTGVGAEGFHITPLAFGVQGVEHQAGFARAAGPGEHRQLVGADVDVDVFEVVLAGASDAYQALCHPAIIPRGRLPSPWDRATGF